MAFECCFEKYSGDIYWVPTLKVKLKEQIVDHELVSRLSPELPHFETMGK